MAEFNGKQIMLVGLKGDKGEKGDKGDKGDVGDNFVIYPENYLKEIVISAYNDEEFRNSIAFSYATDKDDDGNLIYGNIALITEEIINDENNQPIGAEYSMICNGLLYHIILKENGSDYDFEVENPYYRKDDEILAEAIASVSNAKVGITSQYVTQPSDVKEGSNIYINAKLRDSVNILDIDNSNIDTFSDRTTFTKNNDGSIVLTFVEQNDGVSDYTLIPTSLDKLGLQVGDTITFSSDCSISDSSLKFQVAINFIGVEIFSSVYTNSGGRASITAIIPQGTTKINLLLEKTYGATIPSGTTFTFSNIQLQKGNVATAYEPFGAYSKGKVMQYASKNILNLPGTKQTANTTSLIGKANVPYTIPNATTSQLLPQNDGSFGTTNANAKRINVKKNHKYFVLLDGNFQGSIPDAFGIYDSDFVFMNSAQVQLVDNGHTYCGIITPSKDANDGFVANMYWYGTNRYFTQGDDVLGMIVIDLTSNGDHNLTVEEAYDKYSSSLSTLQNGGSVANNVYQSPLIKVYSKDLYLTKPSGYTLTLYEFKENPKSLNANVDIDDYELLKVSEYSSSGAITLQPNTNSIVYFLYASSTTDLLTWQAASQLEYGNEATEHSDYVAPIEIGTFDKAVDGNEKTLSFVVLGTENQNIGFIPSTENDISIDFASDVSDTTKSTFAYTSTNLANQVAELESRVSDLETEVFELQENLQVPTAPLTGHYVLECIDGVLTWVIKE